MTPKEKAKELVDNFYQLFPLEMDVTVAEGDLSWEYNGWQQSKRCALIAVDEILKSVPKQPSISITMPHFEATVYWEEVKQEIEKL